MKCKEILISEKIQKTYKLIIDPNHDENLI